MYLEARVFSTMTEIVGFILSMFEELFCTFIDNPFHKFI